MSNETKPSADEIKSTLTRLLHLNAEETIAVASKMCLPWRETGNFFERVNITGRMVARVSISRPWTKSDADESLMEQGYTLLH